MKSSIKTIKVRDIVDSANKMLQSNDEFLTAEAKKGICTLLEGILFENNAYQGFTFINSNDCKVNTFGYWSRKYIYKIKAF